MIALGPRLNSRSNRPAPAVWAKRLAGALGLALAGLCMHWLVTGAIGQTPPQQYPSTTYPQASFPAAPQFQAPQQQAWNQSTPVGPPASLQTPQAPGNQQPQPPQTHLLQPLQGQFDQPAPPQYQFEFQQPLIQYPGLRRPAVQQSAYQQSPTTPTDLQQNSQLLFVDRPRPKVTELGETHQSPYHIALQPTPPTPPAARGQNPVEIPPGQPVINVPPNQTPPTPAASPFGADQVRLPLLDSNGTAIGATPKLTPEVQRQFSEFVDRTVEPQNTLDLIQNRPRLVVLKRAPIRIQVADENIATYTLIADTQLSVTGVAIGTTVLNLWFAEPNAPPTILSYLVRVIPDPELKERLERVYKALEVEINRAFPNSVVHLSLVGDKLVVSGEAKDVIDAAHILRVVAANAPGGGRSGRNAVDSDEIPVGQINLTANANLFGGAGAGQLPAQGLENFLLRNPIRNVINLLHVPGEQQVMLRVTVAEVNRTAARSIGMDFSITNKEGITVFAQATNAVASSMAAPGNLPTLLDNGQVALGIRALRSINLARSLAEPNLVTLNGQSAQFRAGGEFPVPAATQSFGGVGQGVAFVPFGVSLNFLPTITDRDRVRLEVSANVSTLDPTLGTNIGGAASAGGTSVSGLQTRTFTNVVELRSGQTLAVAGLIQNNFGATTNRVPLFGDIPILGNLAGRNDTTSGDQELVMLVTPELVGPLQACNTPQLPGADVYEPGDIEFYLLGRLESRRSEDYRTDVRTDWHRMKNYEHCEDRFIIGTKGHSFNCCGPDCNCPKD